MEPTQLLETIVSTVNIIYVDTACMAIVGSSMDVPAWVIGLFLVLVGVSLLYGGIVMQTLVAPILFWAIVLLGGMLLFIVYLLYRFVVAVETIAEKL